MTKVNQDWYISEDYMSLPHLGMLTEQVDKTKSVIRELEN